MSIYANILTGVSNNHETTSENANQIATDFIAEGVVGAITNTAGVAPATGAFAVNAQGTPDMTVAVSAGVAYVTATPSGQASQTLRIYNNASANVTIAANSSGSTKYDWVYISISAANAANPNSAGDNVATLVVSRSSSASTDDGTPPTYGYPLAVVTVANAASSITNGTITDIRARTGLESNRVVANPYKFRVRRVAAQNTTGNTSVKINFDTEDFDTNNNFDNATNFRYTAPVSGFYQFNAVCNTATNAGSFLLISLYKNGAAYQRGGFLDGSAPRRGGDQVVDV